METTIFNYFGLLTPSYPFEDVWIWLRSTVAVLLSMSMLGITRFSMRTRTPVGEKGFAWNMQLGHDPEQSWFWPHMVPQVRALSDCKLAAAALLTMRRMTEMMLKCIIVLYLCMRWCWRAGQRDGPALCQATPMCLMYVLHLLLRPDCHHVVCSGSCLTQTFRQWFFNDFQKATIILARYPHIFPQAIGLEIG